MQALLPRPWVKRLLVAGAFTALTPMATFAGWPWAARTPAPVIPVGPPIYAPATAPVVANYQPVPAAVAPTLVAPPTGYGAPLVTAAPAVPYGAAPVAAPGACGTCGAARVTAGYVPPNYQTNFIQVPTTTYRPVASVDPATGLPINAVQPCTTNVWQARRVPNTLWGGMWPTATVPPTIVAYSPATIAAYPAPRIVTQYAPPTTIIAPGPTTVRYAPAQIVQYAPAPVVTQYAPAPVQQYQPAAPPVVTQYAPAPAPVQQYAPAPAAPACGCPTGACQHNHAAPAPSNVGPGYGQTAPSAPAYGSPGTTYPPRTYPGSLPSNVVPQGAPITRDPASVAPRLDPNDLNSSTQRNYAPTEYDNPAIVPVAPPPERRVVQPPVIEQRELQSPPNGSSSSTIRSPAPFLPFSRPTDRPASTPKTDRPLRLVPDPDAERLDLRRDEIPSLIKPGDKTTQAKPMRGFSSVPITWPTKSVAAVPATVAAPKLDDSGWRSAQK
jgi:hypothetical protein